jgi:hypothetical protein
VKSFRRISLATVAVLAVSALAFGGEMETAKGRVKAVSGNIVAVALEDGPTWEFEVAEGTKVLAVGAGTKSADLEMLGRKKEIAQFVQEDDLVTVKYWEEDGTRYIKKLRIH